MNSGPSVCPSCGASFTPFVRNGVMVPICSPCEQGFIARGLLPALPPEPGVSLQPVAPQPPLATAQSPFSPNPAAGRSPQAAVSVSEDEGPRMDPRFAPLSSLPPDKRLPPKRQAAPAVASAPVQPPAASPVGNPESAPPQATVRALPQPIQPIPTEPKPRQLPGMAPLRPTKVQEKRIGFNCPSCLAVLIIKQPEDYDGSAAPCPNCGTHILPPRIANVSPFKLVQPDTSQQLSGGKLPVRRDLPVLPAVPLATPIAENESKAKGLPNRSGLINAAIL